jgi:hypothetical protein
VDFVAEGKLRGVMRVLQPAAKRLMARRMAAYHRNLRRIVEAGESASAEGLIGGLSS